MYEAIPDRKFERCSIVAGKCDIVAPFGYTGTCNSKLFLMWVQEILVTNLEKNQIVIMDNATIHKSPKIKEAIEKAGCRLVYLPPYSPDLNPIEHFWHHLKLKIASSKQKFDSSTSISPVLKHDSGSASFCILSRNSCKILPSCARSPSIPISGQLSNPHKIILTIV